DDRRPRPRDETRREQPKRNDERKAPVKSSAEIWDSEINSRAEKRKGVQRENRDATRQSDRTQDHTDRRNNSYSRDRKDQRDQRDQDKPDQRNRNERNRTDQRERMDRRDCTEPREGNDRRDRFTVGTLSLGVDRRRYNDTRRGDASSRRCSHGGTRGMRGRGRGRVINSGKPVGKAGAASKIDDENDSEDYHSALSSVDFDESDSEEVFDKQDDGRRDDKRPTRSYYYHYYLSS
ncbi:Hypothetical predicted protein, partial [Paramuricea clavata]